MWNPFACKCCKAQEDEIKHLRGLIDRLMTQIAPKPVDEDPSENIIPEDE